MKKLTKIAIGLMFFAPLFVFAEDSHSTSTRNLKGPGEKFETIKDKMEQRGQELENKIEDHKFATSTPRIWATSTATSTDMQDRIKKMKDEAEKRKEDIQNSFKNRIFNFMRSLFGRYDAAIDRFTKLSSRIQSRITKIEAEGIDESNAKALLVVANGKIDAAKTAVANLKSVASSTVGMATSTTDLKTIFPTLNDSIKSTNEAIKAAQSALVDVVKNIKPGKNKEDRLDGDEATSTATTTRE